MIKKNLILTVTEKTTSGEELLYTIKSVADRSTFLLASGAPEVLVNDADELLEAIATIQKFGVDNPTVEDTSKVVAQDDGTLVVEYGENE